VDQYLRTFWRIVPDPEWCEYVRTPRLQFYLGQQSGFYQGDCDDAATFAAALVKAQGNPCYLIAIRGNGSEEFGHVWLNADGIDIDPVTPASALPISRESYAEEMVLWI
jgi:hypothetical protein